MSKLKIFLIATVILGLFLMLGNAFEMFALIWIWFGTIVSLSIFGNTIDDILERASPSDIKLYSKGNTIAFTAPKIVILFILLLLGHLITAVFYTIASLFIGAQHILVRQRLEQRGELT